MWLQANDWLFVRNLGFPSPPGFIAIDIYLMISRDHNPSCIYLLDKMYVSDTAGTMAETLQWFTRSYITVILCEHCPLVSGNKSPRYCILIYILQNYYCTRISFSWSPCANDKTDWCNLRVCQGLITAAPGTPPTPSPRRPSLDDNRGTWGVIL